MASGTVDLPGLLHLGVAFAFWFVSRYIGKKAQRNINADQRERQQHEGGGR